MSRPADPEGPRLAQALLAACLPEHVRDSVMGDLAEAHARRVTEGRASSLWYWRQAVSLGTHYLVHRLMHRRRAFHDDRETRRGEMTMNDLWTDIRLALRGFRKTPGFTLASVLVLPWGDGIPLEIVGIVGDTRDRGPAMDPSPMFYLPIRQNPGGLGTMRMVMRTAGDPMTAGSALRQVVWAVDSDVPVSGIETMDDRLAFSVTQPKFRATLVGLFALTALVLSALGLYAVLAFFVRQNSHEIAVRVAVGAGRGDVMRLVLRRGLSLVGLGVFFGLVGGLVGGKILQGFLFGVEARDPLTLSVVTVTMLGVAFVASLVPALRAARTAPVEALNTE